MSTSYVQSKASISASCIKLRGEARRLLGVRMLLGICAESQRLQGCYGWAVSIGPGGRATGLGVHNRDIVILQS